jgi:hypothetical protein
LLHLLVFKKFFGLWICIDFRLRQRLNPTPRTPGNQPLRGKRPTGLREVYRPM